MFHNTIIFASVVTFLLSGCLSKPENIGSEADANTHGPVMVNSIKPVYPDEAKAKGVEGTVWVKMWVDSLGRVKTVFINESPDPVLNEPAFQAAVQTKFKPAMRDGKRIGVWLIAPFEVKKE